MSRFPFVTDHRHAFEVKRLCEIVEVARSSFYPWLGAAPTRAARAAADAQLADRIRQVHQADRTQGVPRITAELNDGVSAQERVNHKRVARVMRAHAMAGLRLRRRVRTTDPGAGLSSRYPTCSAETSPRPRPTSATSATSPTCQSLTAPTCTWQQSSTASPAA